jgi:hypothetical protein
MLLKTCINRPQIPVSYKSDNEVIFVFKPVFKHYQAIESTIGQQYTTLGSKLKDFMDGLYYNRILSRTFGLLVTERFEQYRNRILVTQRGIYLYQPVAVYQFAGAAVTNCCQIIHLPGKRLCDI